jgi:hypothetical protein
MSVDSKAENILKSTESIIKVGVATPLLLVMGNHLGGFLPLPFSTETSLSTTKRVISLCLIFFLIVISISGSIDWSIFANPDPDKKTFNVKWYPLLDLFASVVAGFALLMTLRLASKYMYLVLAVLILTTILMFYAAKASVDTETNEAGEEVQVLSSKYKKWITSVKWLVMVTAVAIILMYLLSIRFINANYSELFDTTRRFYASGDHGQLDVYNIHLTPQVGFFDYMFHPVPIDPSKFKKVDTWDNWKKGGNIFLFGEGYGPQFFFGGKGYGPKLAVTPTLSDKTNNHNEVTRASQEYIMSSEKIPDGGSLWNNSPRTFNAEKLGRDPAPSTQTLQGQQAGGTVVGGAMGRAGAAVGGAMGRAGAAVGGVMGRAGTAVGGAINAIRGRRNSYSNLPPDQGNVFINPP